MMSELEDTNNSLVIEDTSNPQSVNFVPETKEPKAEPKPLSGREAIEASLAKVEKETGTKIGDDDAPKPEPKAKAEPKEPVEAKPKAERAPDGKFQPRQQEATQEAPETVQQNDQVEQPRTVQGERDITRPPESFLPRAREKWADAPEEVRSEVYRAIDEFQKGKQQYQESHQFRKELQPFEDMAKQNGVTVKQALENYTAIDRELRQNPVAGLEKVFQAAGIDPVQYAQHILGQAQLAQENPAYAHTQQLERQVQQLQQQLQQFTQMTQQQQQEAQQQEIVQKAMNDIITPFRESLGEDDRYEELVDDIAFFLNSGKIPSTLSAQQRLAEAYHMAERLNPAPRVSTSKPTRPLNPAGGRSIKGSLNGTEYSGKGPTLNPREAIEAAAAQLGL